MTQRLCNVNCHYINTCSDANQDFWYEKIVRLQINILLWAFFFFLVISDNDNYKNNRWYVIENVD